MSSIGGGGGGGSVASNMSGLSVLFGKHPHPGANGEHNDVFRSSVAGDDNVGDRKKNSDSSSTTVSYTHLTLPTNLRV